MGNWRDAIPSKWLKAADLEGKPHLFTIKGFSVEKMNDGSTCPVVWFREQPKGFVLNVTNGTSIEHIAGSKDPDVWKAKAVRVVLYPTETDLRGERVDCIRVRAPKPGAKLPAPPQEEELVEVDPIDEGHFTPTDDDVPF